MDDLIVEIAGTRVRVPWEAVVGLRPAVMHDAAKGSDVRATEIILSVGACPLPMDRVLEMWKQALTRPRLVVPAGPIPPG